MADADIECLFLTSSLPDRVPHPRTYLDDADLQRGHVVGSP